MTERRAPIDLRAEVARTLTPVTPNAAPERRVFAFLALGALWLMLVPILWGVRYDAPTLGVPGLWVMSALQLGVAMGVLRYALAEAVPGRLGNPRRLAFWAALGALLMLAITGLTFFSSPTYVPPLRATRYLYTCSTRTFALGLPPLALAGWLMRRGLTTRPMVAGALAGLGSGLVADSSWRIYCEVSDPYHVLTAHASGVLALCALGALAGLVVSRIAARDRLTRWS